MAKWTLLEIVSDILSDMSGDYVSSITDTEESEQVAQIVKSTYQSMLSNRNWPHTLKLLNLTPSGDNTLPTHMRIEDNLKDLLSIYYNQQKSGSTQIVYRPVRYVQPDDFLRHINARNSDNVNTTVVLDPSGVQLLIITNKPPEFVTSFDDTTLIFDSYDSTVDTTLQASKTQARGYVTPDFEMENDFVPDLPEKAFSALIEEAKSRCMIRLKQVQDPKAEQDARSQNRFLARQARRASAADPYPFNYGRGRHRHRDPTFRNNN